jgi:Fe-S oxidoreductase
MRCELCSVPGASFADCADYLLLSGGYPEGFIPRAFGGALDAIVTIQLRGKTSQNRLDWVKPDIEIVETADKDGVALFVGCAPYYDALLADRIGYTPTSEAHAAVTLLNGAGVKPVVLRDEVCCGGDRLHTGAKDDFIALGSRNRDLFRERGVKTILTVCNDCRFTLGRRYPGRIPDWDFQVMSVTDYLLNRRSNLGFMPTRSNAVVQSPDRYSDPGNLDSVRKLIGMIPELDLKEFAGHPHTFGSWNIFGGISKSIETVLLKAAESTGAEMLLIESTRPLLRLLEGRDPGSWEETSIAIAGLYGFLSSRHVIARDFAGA